MATRQIRVYDETATLIDTIARIKGETHAKIVKRAVDAMYGDIRDVVEGNTEDTLNAIEDAESKKVVKAA